MVKKLIILALAVVMIVTIFASSQAACQQHNYQWVTAQEATCTTAGTRVYQCRYCPMIAGTAAIPAHGHHYLPATYSRPMICDICGNTSGAPLGH